jgi:hypothetical protein
VWQDAADALVDMLDLNPLSAHITARKKQNWLKPVTQSHGSSLPSQAMDDIPEVPKTAGLQYIS